MRYANERMIVIQFDVFCLCPRLHLVAQNQQAPDVRSAMAAWRTLSNLSPILRIHNYYPREFAPPPEPPKPSGRRRRDN